MDPRQMNVGKRFRNKENNDIIEVVEIDGEKMFESDFGVWSWVDEDLFQEIYE